MGLIALRTMGTGALSSVTEPQARGQTNAPGPCFQVFARILLPHYSPGSGRVSMRRGGRYGLSGHLALSASELLAGGASNAWPLRYAVFL